jgi:preprotein translocase subunit Sss1
MTDFDFKKPELPKKPTTNINPEANNEAQTVDIIQTNKSVETITAPENIIQENKEKEQLATEEKPKKNRDKLKSFLIVLLLCFILIGSLGYGIYLASDKIGFWSSSNKQSSKTSSTNESIGAFVAYDEGKITENEIGGEKKTYTNDLFPNLKISSNNGNIWRITESDKTRNNLLKYDLILKNNDLNIIFSFYSDNGGLNKDSLCMKDSDITTLNQTWNKEIRYNEVYETPIGFYFMPRTSYFTKTSPEYAKRYDNYLKFISNYSKNILNKDDAVYCSTAQRVMYSKTNLQQPNTFNNENNVLLRIFTPKPDLNDKEKEIINDLFSNLNI